MSADRATRVAVPLAVAEPPLRGAMRVQRLSGEIMGTTWSVAGVLPARMSAETLNAAIVRSLDAVVSQMSAWVPHSDLSRFNRAEPGSSHALPAEFFCVLDYALGVAAKTDGAYDPTVGALASLWGFGPEGRATRVPSDEAIAAARALCGWRRIRLTRSARSAIQPGGLIIDLCAVGKGFAVDCLADVMRAHGCTDFLVEIGGELRGEGCKPDGSPWWVSVEPPRAAAVMPQTLIALHDVSVATSGDQRRHVEHGGRRYGHTLDPRTGYPVNNGIVSVTVVAEMCMEADALSTALYVLGEEEGRMFAARHGIAALFVMEEERGLRENLSPAFEAMLL